VDVEENATTEGDASGSDGDVSEEETYEEENKAVAGDGQTG